MLYKGDSRRWEIIHSMESFFDYVYEEGDTLLDYILDEYLKDNGYPEKEDFETEEEYCDQVNLWYDGFIAYCTDIANDWES